MITDGKPSALTLADGRIYKNAFGLDPLVIEETLEEVSTMQACGNHDQHLHARQRLYPDAVRPEGERDCRGKAYFTTPETLGNYLLMDFMSRRMKTVH